MLALGMTNCPPDKWDGVVIGECKTYWGMANHMFKGRGDDRGNDPCLYLTEDKGIGIGILRFAGWDQARYADGETLTPFQMWATLKHLSYPRDNLKPRERKLII